MVVKSDDIRDTPVDSRNCLFPEERNERLDVFKQYSQAACFTECMMSYARSTCHCTPWDFPFADDDEGEICSFYGYYCFHEAMKNLTHRTRVCDCLPDCNVVNFQVTLTTTPIDPETECGAGKVAMLATRATCLDLTYFRYDRPDLSSCGTSWSVAAPSFWTIWAPFSELPPLELSPHWEQSWSAAVNH